VFFGHPFLEPHVRLDKELHRVLTSCSTPYDHRPRAPAGQTALAVVCQARSIRYAP
jgi:hypothetical protein